MESRLDAVIPGNCGDRVSSPQVGHRSSFTMVFTSWLHLGQRRMVIVLGSPLVV